MMLFDLNLNSVLLSLFMPYFLDHCTEGIDPVYNFIFFPVTGLIYAAVAYTSSVDLYCICSLLVVQEQGNTQKNRSTGGLS